MRLLHYSDKPVLAVRDADQTKKPRHDKPRGLWLSVEGPDDWRDWCEGNDYHLGKLVYEVALRREARILRLEDEADIRRFTKQWGVDPYAGIPGTMFHAYGIRWPEIVARYDGIIIAPYCWPLRLEVGVHWYYSWDCASGCVWRAGAVESVRLVTEERRLQA